MKSICVFCGANWGNKIEFEQAAITLGTEIANRGFRLIYGGSSVGLMGGCADAALAAGGEVIGILPDALKEKEIDHKGLTELHITHSMHERKTMMADMSDAFISLPGGVGTLDEMFEMITWATLNWHEKPSALFNVCGYYDDLARFLDRSVSDGFVKAPHRDMLIISDKIDDLFSRIANYQAPKIKKWIEKKNCLGA